MLWQNIDFIVMILTYFYDFSTRKQLKICKKKATKFLRQKMSYIFKINIPASFAIK